MPVSRGQRYPLAAQDVLTFFKYCQSVAHPTTHWLKLGIPEKSYWKTVAVFCETSLQIKCMSISLFLYVCVSQTYQADEDDAGARLEVLFFVFGILIN